MLATAWGFKFKKKEGKFNGEICILQMNVLINVHLTIINFKVFKEGLLKNLKFYKKNLLLYVIQMKQTFDKQWYIYIFFVTYTRSVKFLHDCTSKRLQQWFYRFNLSWMDLNDFKACFGTKARTGKGVLAFVMTPPDHPYALSGIWNSQKRSLSLDKVRWSTY